MAEKEVLIFDLDDTLVDTYGELITPLERRAADLIGSLDGVTLSAENILAALLALRRRSPGEFYSRLEQLVPERAELVTRTHRRVFEDFPVEALELAASVTRTLRQLSRAYRLVLLTEGNPKIQRAKIAHLGIEKVFPTILISNPQAGDTKLELIRRFMRDSQACPARIFVIGNRIDNEIAAANKLGAKAIWVRAGEGSEAEDAERYADATVGHVSEIPDVLRRLSSQRVCADE